MLVLLKDFYEVVSTTPPGVKSQGTAVTSGYQEVLGCWWPPGVCFHRQRRWDGYSIEQPAMHRERNIFMTQRPQEAALNQVAGFLVNFTGLVSAAHVGFGNWWVWGGRRVSANAFKLSAGGIVLQQRASFPSWSAWWAHFLLERCTLHVLL